MKKSILLTFLSLTLIYILVACSSTVVTKPAETTGPSIIDINKCTCVQLWMPVCGENGKTYSNSCFAKCAGVNFKQGSCSKVITD